MIKILTSGEANFESRLAEVVRGAAVEEVGAVQQQVNRIRDEVQTRGDDAVLKLTAQLDNHHADSIAALQVSDEQLQAAVNEIPQQLKADLETTAARLKDYHTQQLQHAGDWNFTDSHGNCLGERVRAVARAVVYAPGGRAVYPSSVLMGVIPARVAGVREVVLTTPARDGEVSPILLAAAAIAGAHRVFLIGGAQAVFAFAYGTQTLPAADVIVGPGNAYVTEAKRQVFGTVGIDSLAGPSEVLILSDASANADWVAADMLAQAEHDEMARCILITTDEKHLQAVKAALAAQIETLPRKEIIRTALANCGALIKCKDWDEGCRIANDIAAEHVQVMTEASLGIGERIDNAGGLFIGQHTCVPLGDYVAGTNHILPTGRNARFASPLGVQQFLKRTSILQTTEEGASSLAAVAERLATAEGLTAHAASARRRIKPA